MARGIQFLSDPTMESFSGGLDNKYFMRFYRFNVKLTNLELYLPRPGF